MLKILVKFVKLSFYIELKLVLIQSFNGNNSSKPKNWFVYINNHILNKMVSIYVLLLENNKFYVGKTKELDFRLEQHFNGKGSTFTQKYKPIKVFNIFTNCDDFDEDKYTLKFMSEYGINNVRGGSFCELDLPDESKKTILKMINGSNDKCYIFG